MNEGSKFSNYYNEEEDNQNLTIENNNLFFRSVSSHKKYLINPAITKFNSLSNFIYDIDEGDDYINSVKNANYIKLNENEKKTLEEKCNEIQKLKEQNNSSKFILLQENLLKEINEFFNFRRKEEPLTIFLKNEYKNENKNANDFTTRKLSNKYFLRTGEKISHSTINSTLKKSLGLHYLKVVPKSSKILSIESVICSMAIIKIIARCIKQGISIIYCDESSILSTNNNFRAWIQPRENFYTDIAPKKRYNLIMAINELGVLYYEINSTNTNENSFMSFMENLKKIIEKNNIGNYAVFLDNLSAHKTKKMIKYYAENGINIIFNTPYFSTFNSIELAFRSIKNLLYKKVYNDKNKVIEDVHNIINNADFQKTLKYNFKETIIEYLKFYNRYKSINFNKYKK